MDRNELPGVLRGSSRLGLAALMFTLVMMCFEIAEHAPLDIPFDPASLEYMTLWSRVIAISASMLSVFAVITVIPTGWCLIWEARLRRKHQSTAPRDS
ncbi:hypothetical protein [Roseimicrobium gellanilyticum]|nr:hypothetical protein [Roseimicrobium gellanilyticum]